MLERQLVHGGVGGGDGVGRRALALAGAGQVMRHALVMMRRAGGDAVERIGEGEVQLSLARLGHLRPRRRADAVMIDVVADFLVGGRRPQQPLRLEAAQRLVEPRRRDRGVERTQQRERDRTARQRHRVDDRAIEGDEAIEAPLLEPVDGRTRRVVGDGLARQRLDEIWIAARADGHLARQRRHSERGGEALHIGVAERSQPQLEHFGVTATRLHEVGEHGVDVFGAIGRDDEQRQLAGMIE